MTKRHWIGLLSAVLGTGAYPAAAEPLRDLLENVCSSVQGIPAAGTQSRNCSSTPQGISVNLSASRIERSRPLPPVALPDGRSIRLYHALLYNGSLTPELWMVKPGDTLGVTLRNRLLPERKNKLVHLTNLHVHGLIVRPELIFAGDAADPLRASRAGDNIFACTAHGGRGNECAHMVHMADPSVMEYRIQLPASHPEGLFWYHPHIHGTSGEQVARGMAGLIWVQRSDGPPASKTRYLMLKDLHVRNVAAADSAAGLRGEVFYPEEIAPKGCASDPGANRGVCATGKRSLWLFTVNGQVYPSVDFDASGGEIWRIANTSASATYLLRLQRTDTAGPIPLQVLAKDGVAIPQGEAAAPARWANEILMMPASRVSIYVKRPADMPEETLRARLESAGFSTGATADDGDRWPAVSLLDVAFGPRRSDAEARGEIAVAGFGAAHVSGSLHELPPGVDALEGMRNSNRLYAQHAGHAATSAPPTVDGPCPQDSKVDLAPGESRLIAFNIAPAGDTFLIGAGLIPSRAAISGQPLTPQVLNVALQKATSWQHYHAPQICARAGRRETWIIANPNTAAHPASGSNRELHNFHIHQNQFRVLDVYAAPGSGFQMASDFWKDSYHDTFPVPSGGWIRIALEFGATQVGDFVYHCHILEHEDRGMMAHIRVLP